MRKVSILVGLAGLVAGFLVAAPAAPALAASQNNNGGNTNANNNMGGPTTPHSPHTMPKQNGPQTASAPAGAHLTYYGGRIMSNPKVEDVFWGSGTFESGVGPGGQMPAFFNQVGASEYFDWLTEYNTNLKAQNGQQGTNQMLGHARSLGETTISPAPANDASTIDDSNMQAELQAQLNSGGLPAPLTDGRGNVDTLYALFFPQGHVLTSGSGQGGVQWCAYHGTIVWNGLSVPYMVLPDFLDTSGGANYVSGCGGNASTFNNFTSVTSHELVESTTDTEVGIAGAVGPPLAWYDNFNNQGEIGDICNGQQGSIVSWVVQQQFSNRANNCIVTPGTPANDFSLSPSPASLTIVQGNSGSTTINSAVTRGSVLQTLTESVGDIPTGGSASVSSSSISVGVGNTLTVNAGAAAPGTYTLNVMASNGAIVHTVPVDVTITSATSPDFVLSANPSAITTSDGTTTTSTVSSTAIGGAQPPISLSVAGMPSGMTASLNPTSVAVGSSSTLTILSGTAATGVYPLTVTGQNSGHTHTTTVTVTVKIKTALVASALHNTGFHPTAKLTRTDTGAGIAGQTISFKPSFGNACFAVTNAAGVAQCSSIAFNGFTASYGGNATYLPSSASGAG